MAVLLGSSGQIELRRSSQNEGFSSVISPSDINTTKGRFSFDFPQGMLLTGDQVSIRTTDGSELSFVSPSGWYTPGVYSYPDGTWHIAVDEVGGIRLYRSFDAAVSGEAAGRVQLQAITRDIPIEVRVTNLIDRIVGQVTDFELNTSREAVDVTELGEEFRKQHATTISGSGQLSCFFDYERRLCDNLSDLSVGAVEMPIYLHQLLLRTQLGSGFWAKLTLASRGLKPGGRAEDYDDEVWYEFDALVTNVGIAFEPTQPVKTTVQFITTGEIRLRTRMVSNYILQEQGGRDRIRLEANQNGFLEKEDQE
jgi:hypothetical protein